jgi:hypothetical protein
MTRPRHLIMTATLAVAFLSAGAFAGNSLPAKGVATASVATNITVISKS